MSRRSRTPEEVVRAFREAMSSQASERAPLQERREAGRAMSETKAEMVARIVREQIEAGLHDGTALPPTRWLAERYDVSVFTINEAMAILEKEGVVESRDRSGRVVRRLPKPQETGAPALLEWEVVEWEAVMRACEVAADAARDAAHDAATEAYSLGVRHGMDRAVAHAEREGEYLTLAIIVPANLPIREEEINGLRSIAADAVERWAREENEREARRDGREGTGAEAQ